MEKIAISDKGHKRENNQDYSFMDPKNRYFILADGMGGHNGGEIASYTAVTTVHGLLKDFIAEDANHVQEKLREVVSAANDIVYRKSIEAHSLSGMGTTLVICYFCKNLLIVAHAGDSRAYIFSDDKLTRLTKDHSLVQQMIESGELSKEEARRHPKRHVITRAVGTGSSIEPDIDIVDLSDKNEFTVIMCTDGLTDFVDDAELAEICRRRTSLSDCSKEMLEMALGRGGLDNISITALRINETFGSVDI